MEYTLEKPLTRKQRADFILNYVIKYDLSFEEDNKKLRAFKKSEEEKEIEQKL